MSHHRKAYVGTVYCKLSPPQGISGLLATAEFKQHVSDRDVLKRLLRQLPKSQARVSCSSCLRCMSLLPPVAPALKSSGRPSGSTSASSSIGTGIRTQRVAHARAATCVPCLSIVAEFFLASFFCTTGPPQSECAEWDVCGTCGSQPNVPNHK